jgi:hypothetical protein
MLPVGFCQTFDCQLIELEPANAEAVKARPTSKVPRKISGRVKASFNLTARKVSEGPARGRMSKRRGC